MEVRNHSNFVLYLWIIFENDQLLEWRLTFSVGDTDAFFEINWVYLEAGTRSSL